MLSKLVNVAIQSKPLYSVMKVLAKKTMRDTAEGRGIPWLQNIQDLTAQLEVSPRNETYANPQTHMNQGTSLSASLYLELISGESVGFGVVKVHGIDFAKTLTK